MIHYVFCAAGAVVFLVVIVAVGWLYVSLAYRGAYPAWVDDVWDWFERRLGR